MTSTQFQRNFGQAVINVQHEPILVERSGKKIGFFVSAKDWEMSLEERQLSEELWESKDLETQKVIKEGRKNKTEGLDFNEWLKS